MEEKGTCNCRDTLTLLALLDFLVDPLLPSTSTSTLRDAISLSQQESLAKQVHAVVLLYNYYHRKHHPELEFLELRSFCELAVDLKPSLQLYFNVMQNTDCSKLEELDKDLSLTEKAIMSACDTSKGLDASKNNPIIDDWPISKVAVFLVDSRKENCILLHSSITQGVWSVIEKEINHENQESDALVEARSLNKKTQILKGADATSFHQLAFLAVKEACGFNQSDLKILDKHSVYSTSKPKTTARLYIMKCIRTIENMNLVPINDVMESLQGSLVDNECVTPVVEYFHLIPFAEKVLDWLKSGREMSENSSQHSEATKEDEIGDNSMSGSPKHCEASDARFGNNEHLKGKSYPDASQPSEDQAEITNARIFYSDKDNESRPCNSLHPKSGKGVKNVTICQRKEKSTEILVYNKRNRSKKNSTTNKFSYTKTSNAPENYPRQEAKQSEATASSNSMQINGKRGNTCEDVHDKKLKLSVQETDQAVLTGQAMDVKINDVAISNDTGEQDGAIVPFDSDFDHLCKMQLTLDSKGPSVSRTVLNILLRKRKQLSEQLRNIADEIAICEANIQTVLRGSEDQLTVQTETLVDSCNDISQLNSDGAGEHQDPSPVLKRRRLSEAILNLLSPCQELDGICSKNFWMLPNYIVSPLEGGFQATVNVKGVDFDCSSEGTTCKTPLEARSSAASKIMVKLRSLAAES